MKTSYASVTVQEAGYYSAVVRVFAPSSVTSNICFAKFTFDDDASKAILVVLPFFGSNVWEYVSGASTFLLDAGSYSLDMMIFGPSCSSE